MNRTVIWSDRARIDLLDQIAYLSADNPAAAERILERIETTGNKLGGFATGHPGRAEGTYEKSVRGLPYILAYALNDADGTVTILRLIHTARDWQEGHWPE